MPSTRCHQLDVMNWRHVQRRTWNEDWESGNEVNSSRASSISGIAYWRNSAASGDWVDRWPPSKELLFQHSVDDLITYILLQYIHITKLVLASARGTRSRWLQIIRGDSVQSSCDGYEIYIKKLIMEGWTMAMLRDSQSVCLVYTCWWLCSRSFRAMETDIPECRDADTLLEPCQASTIVDKISIKMRIECPIDDISKTAPKFSSLIFPFLKNFITSESLHSTK